MRTLLLTLLLAALASLALSLTLSAFELLAPSPRHLYNYGVNSHHKQRRRRVTARKAKDGLKLVTGFAVSALVSGATAWAVLAYAGARGVEKAAGFVATRAVGR